MPTPTDNPSRVLEATEGFAADVDGVKYVIQAKIDRVAASHPLAKRFPQYFKPVEDDLAYTDTATATADSERREQVSRRARTNTTTKE